MSDNGAMEQFNINELAGATGLILGAISGILVIIFKSRCYCKFRVGISDKFNICMCERKPPPEPQVEETDEENQKVEKPNIKKPKPNIKLKEEQLVPEEIENEPEIITTTNQNNNP